jgi:hypothetical protein
MAMFPFSVDCVPTSDRFFMGDRGRDNQQEEPTAATELGPIEAVFAATVGVAWTVNVIVAFSPFVGVGVHSVDYDNHDVGSKRARVAGHAVGPGAAHAAADI